MFKLLKLSESLGVADQMRVTNDIQPMVEKHRAFLASKHADADAFVEGALAHHAAFVAQDPITEREKGEADQALGDRTAIYAQSREYVRAVRRRVRRAAKLLRKKDDVKKARALLRDYGITGNRDNLNRVSHLERALTRVVNAHGLHQDTLIAWGSTPEFIAQGMTLAETIPSVIRRLGKERSEAEQAVDLRDELEARLVESFNDLLDTVETYADDAPAVFADFESVLNKHRSLLEDPRDFDEEDSEDDDLNEPDLPPTGDNEDPEA